MPSSRARCCVFLPILFLAFATLGLSAAPADSGLAEAARWVRRIVAHRGSSIDRPENTLAAYARAIEAGAHAIEVDLRLTRDGHLVSLHDPILDRTTNGTGPVGSLTLAEVQRLDAGRSFAPAWRGERVPTFREILELAKGRADVFLDLKEQGEAYTARVVADIRRWGEPARIILGVRSAEDIRYYRRHLPEASMVGLIPTTKEIEAFAEAGVPVIRLWPHWLEEPGVLERVRKAGASLMTNAGKGTREETVPLLRAKPEMLFTDDPAGLAAVLRGLAAAQDPKGEKD